MTQDRRADVLIIGAGAGGAAAAKRLAEAGMSVVCLEQGGWVDASQYPSTKLEWEFIAEREWHPNPNVRKAPEDYPCDVADADIHPLMFNAVGGSTVHYSGEWLRAVPSDFKVRTLDGIAEDWPLDYDDLIVFYEEIERAMGVSGLAGDPAYPPGLDPPLPSLPIGRIGRTAAKGMNELGWHWWPQSHAIASRPYGRLGACVRHAQCMWGCPEGAKASVDIALWPDALRAGAHLITGARVCEITTDQRGLATGAVWIDRDGRARRQSADVVVVAANGVGTPRLLLLSTSRRFPHGLANSSSLVGKYLMMHPNVSVLGVYEDDLESWLGPFGGPIWSAQFIDTDWSRGFARGAKWSVIPTLGPLHLVMRLSDASQRASWGNAMHQLVDSYLGHSFEWALQIEDLPDELNSVSLSERMTDADGIAAPKITYRLDENTRKAIEYNIARAVDAHLAAGAFATNAREWFPHSGFHLLGTARMGEDAATSVVDPYCRTHDVPNLYIVDGSVFVTSTSVNPTATICAIALRCADHIIENAKNQAVPI